MYKESVTKKTILSHIPMISAEFKGGLSLRWQSEWSTEKEIVMFSDGPRRSLMSSATEDKACASDVGVQDEGRQRENVYLTEFPRAFSTP